MVTNFSHVVPDNVVSGEVAFLRFRVSATDDPESEERLLSFLKEMRRELELEASRTILEVLGNDYELVRLGVRKGSIEILVVVGAIYATISQYKEFVESMNLLVSHLRNLIRRFFRRTQASGISVEATWAPGPPVLLAGKEIRSWKVDRITVLVIWYLILSHAALFVLLAWITIKWTPSR
jgi:hypothetical protein